MIASLRRRFRWAAIGFLIAFSFITVVVLADGLETRHFEALNQSARPATWRGWLDFALLSLDAYVVAGIVGALIGFVGASRDPTGNDRLAGSLFRAASRWPRYLLAVFPAIFLSSLIQVKNRRHLRAER